jgi:hypothetical protein
MSDQVLQPEPSVRLQPAATQSYSLEAVMQMLPPQVELDGIYLVLVLATLAVTWLTCAAFPAHLRTDRTRHAVLQPPASGARQKFND